MMIIITAFLFKCRTFKAILKRAAEIFECRQHQIFI